MRSQLKQKGFTLVELIFVLAIILVLASIFLPLAMSRLADSKTARAQSDLDAIAAALTSFFADIDHFPSCDSSDCDPLSNANNDLKFLAFGTGSGSLTAEYPSTVGGATVWDLVNNDSAALGGEPRNNAFNHLAQNNPDANATVGEAGVDYRTTRWRGPYIARIGVDPFGNAYIVHVGAMERNGTRIGGATGRGWMLSAGPDGVLNTAPTDAALQGDDIGYIFFTQ